MTRMSARELRQRRARRRPRYEEKSEGEVSLWLITFGDIMALMLTFFVLMYAMSSPKEDKWEEVSRGLNREPVSSATPEWYEAGPREISIGRLASTDGLDLTYLRTLLAEAIAGDQRLSAVALIPQDDCFIISLPEDLLFEPGSAKISEKGQLALFTLGGGLTRIRNRIEVVGHTAPRAAEAKGWELSLARAASVASVLEEIGYEKSVVVRGLAGGRYEDMPAQTPKDLRLSLSRRVDILVMRDDGSQKSLLKFDTRTPGNSG